MSINYIKENLKKLDHDNLISFLFDIIVRGGIDDVEDFDETKEYLENEKVYVKDAKGIHHIYKCTVERSTVGRIVDNEWIDLLQSFRKPIITENTITASLDIREEILLAVEPNQREFRLTTTGVEEGLFTIIVFHPTKGRLANGDFEIAGNYIILNEEYLVNNIGEKLIVDLYQKM